MVAATVNREFLYIPNEKSSIEENYNNAIRLYKSYLAFKSLARLAEEEDYDE